MWMPVTDVERLLAAVGTWVSYEAELVSVCRTQTGRGMFEWAQAKLVDAKVNTIMEALSDRLTKVQSLSNETAEAECAKSRSEIAEVANLSLLGQKRSVNIAYRGRMVKHCVTTVEDETQRRKMSEAKGRGVQSGKRHSASGGGAGMMGVGWRGAGGTGRTIIVLNVIINDNKT